MKFKLLLACALLAGAVTTSCVDDIPGIDAKEQYTRDFVKTFGVFDPNQDWNIAKRATVNVTTTKRTTIEFYAEVDGKNYRFGTFTNVIGSHTLKVDVPKGIETLTLKANGRSYTTTDGGTVNIASRAVALDSEGDDNVLDWKDVGKETFPSSVLRGFFDQFQEKQHNLNVGTSSFYFVSDGEWHTFYPIFAQTDKTHALGIYYIPDESKPDEIEMQDLYFTKTGDLVIKQGDSEIGEKAYRGWENIPSDCSSTARGISYRVKAGVRYGFYLKCAAAVEDPKEAIAKANFFRVADGEDEQVVIPNDPDEQNHIFTVFSQGTRNQVWVDKNPDRKESGIQKGIREKGWSASNWWNDELYTELDKYSYASWCEADVYVDGELQTYTYFGFEDWPYSEGNQQEGADLNDLVFIYDNPAPEAYDEDVSATWILACEDLGANDFDFNDVVIGISDVQTDVEKQKTTFKVHALAAGGTLPIYITFNGQELIPEGTNEGEYHSWFEGSHTSSTVINAGGYKATGKVMNVEVDGEWTLAANSDVTIDEANGQGRYGNMGGFAVRVKNDKKDDDKEWRYIEAPSPKGLNHDIGEAPQMICVPGSWYWPTEKTHITKCYPHFTKWCDPDDKSAEGENWYKIHSGSNVVRHNFGAKGSSSGNSNRFDNGPVDPKFSLTRNAISYGVTSQIKEYYSSDLDGIELTNIRYSPEGVVEVDPKTGIITTKKAGEVTITFDTKPVENKYNASENQSVTLTVSKISAYFTIEAEDNTVEVNQTTRILLNGDPDLTNVKVAIETVSENIDDGTYHIKYSDYVEVSNTGEIKGLKVLDRTPTAKIKVTIKDDDIYYDIEQVLEVIVVRGVIVGADEYGVEYINDKEYYVYPFEEIQEDRDWKNDLQALRAKYNVHRIPGIVNASVIKITAEEPGLQVSFGNAYRADLTPVCNTGVEVTIEDENTLNAAKGLNSQAPVQAQYTNVTDGNDYELKIKVTFE